MEDLDDFIEQFTQPDKPERDNSGRPLLVPRAGGERLAYTRASGLGDMLEEFSYLWKWKMRGLTVGLAQSMDLLRLASSETYTCGFADDEQANRESGRRVDQIIDRVMDRAGVDMKADYGTAIHARTEPGNDNIDPDEKQARDVASCWDLWSELGVVNIGTEIFTANDTLRSAGTFDHLSFVPGYGIIVTDKKTSKQAKKTYDIQLSSYAEGDIYDVETDERMTFEEYITSQGWPCSLWNPKVGLIWWVKNGRTQARFLDLEAGYEAAKVAAWIRDERRTLGVAKDVTKDVRAAASTMRDSLLTSLRAAPTVEHITAVWNNPQARAIWTDDHSAAATARRQELTP